MKLTVSIGKKQESFTVPNDSTVDDIKKIVRPNVSIHRQSYKFIEEGGDARGQTLSSGKKLSEYGIKDGSTIIYKDLGPQVGYRTVFIVEYAGPILFILFYALRPSFIYGTKNAAKPFGPTQFLYMCLFIVHFAKREFETLFIHKFSRPTMPLSNIFKNSIYYWSFAAFIGYVLCSPDYMEPTHGLEIPAAIAWGLFELGNFLVHLQLSLMRKSDGDQSRNVPKGPLFALVSCPNYTFEVLGWVAFSTGSSILSSWIFTLVGFLQMAEWAIKKHKGYIKVDAKNKKKSAIIPFLL